MLYANSEIAAAGMEIVHVRRRRRRRGPRTTPQLEKPISRRAGHSHPLRCENPRGSAAALREAIDLRHETGPRSVAPLEGQDIASSRRAIRQDRAARSDYGLTRKRRSSTGTRSLDLLLRALVGRRSSPQTPLAAFVLLLRHDDHLSVGVATGIQGVATSAMRCRRACSPTGCTPVGAAARRSSRSSPALTWRCACSTSRAASPTTRCTTRSAARRRCGASSGAPPVAARRALRRLDRERRALAGETWRSSLRTAGNAVGPLVSIVVFSILGDEWRVDELTYVLLGGVGAMVLPALALFAFSDRRASAPPPRASSRRHRRLSTAPSAALLGADATAAQVAAARSQRRACCCLTTAHIAPLVAIGDLLSMLGSGMTIKFFALFFWQGLGLEPVAVNAVYVAVAARHRRLRAARAEALALHPTKSTGILPALPRHRHRPPRRDRLRPKRRDRAAALPAAYLADELHGGADKVGAQRLRRARSAPWIASSINLFRFGLGGARRVADRRFGYRHTFDSDHAALQLCAAVCGAARLPRPRRERRRGPPPRRPCCPSPPPPPTPSRCCRPRPPPS